MTFFPSMKHSSFCGPPDMALPALPTGPNTQFRSFNILVGYLQVCSVHLHTSGGLQCTLYTYTLLQVCSVHLYTSAGLKCTHPDFCRCAVTPAHFFRSVVYTTLLQVCSVHHTSAGVQCTPPHICRSAVYTYTLLQV